MKTAYWLLAIGSVTYALIFGSGFQTTNAEAQQTKKKSDAANSQVAARTRSGLQALYDFRSDSGPIVQDRSGVGEPVNL